MSLPGAMAGGFTQQQGHGLVIFGAGWTQSTQGFLANGTVIAGNRQTKREVSAYGEYGFTDRLTGIAGASFIRRSVSGPTADAFGGLDVLALGGRVRLLSAGRYTLAIEESLRFPGAHDRLRPAQGGHTGIENDIRLQGAVSFKLWSWPGFAVAEAGYRRRSEGPAPEIRADFTLGLRPARRWLWLLQSFNTFSTGHGGFGYRAVREHKLMTSAVYEIDRAWSIQFGTVGTIAGRNTPRDAGGFLALWYRF